MERWGPGLHPFREPRHELARERSMDRGGTRSLPSGVRRDAAGECRDRYFTGPMRRRMQPMKARRRRQCREEKIEDKRSTDS